MKNIVSGSVIVYISLVSIALVLTGASYAEIGPESLEMIWLFEEGEGETAIDVSGKGRDAQIVGNVEWVEGRFGSALSLPGQGSYVVLPHDDSIVFPEWSLCIWVNLEVAPWQYIFVKETDPGGRNWILHSGPDGFASVAWGWGPDGKVCIARSGVFVNDEEWHHIAGTNDADNLRIYIDGVMKAQTVVPGVPPANDGDVFISGRKGTAPVVGLVDDAGFFNRALTAAEVSDIMNNGLEAAIGGLDGKAVLPEGKLATCWGKIRGTE